MKEDLAIAKNNLLGLYEENKQLKRELGRDVGEYCMSPSGVQITNISEESSTKAVAGGEVEEYKQRLEEERKLRQEADKELEIQVNPSLWNSFEG